MPVLASQVSEEELELYWKWRKSEAYAVPMTSEGEALARQRWYGFKAGWKAKEATLSCPHDWEYVDDGDYGSHWYCTLCGAKKN